MRKAVTQAKSSYQSQIQHTLEERFGLHELRGSQQDVIESVLRREDTLAIMPTGAGKSLCFQLPALIIPGTTLVISPLIALMKDQQEKLQALAIQAIQLNSSLNREEQLQAATEMKSTDLIYTTPECLLDAEFISELKRMTIDFVVIDEAHCLTQWGHDFRPAYLMIRDAIAQLGQPPVLALTATATDQVAADIRQQLNLPKMRIIRSGMFRSNLRYEAILSEDESEKDEALKTQLAGLSGPGIIYAASLKAVEELAHRMAERPGGVARYHGRLSSRERRDEQDRFMSGGADLMIATNAFGMGIDKPDLRFVIHYNFPGSLEAYYQETGRAGRDAQSARCLLLYLKKDQRTQRFFLAGKHPKSSHLVQVYRVLEAAKVAVPLKILQEQCLGVPKSKVRVIVNTLRQAGVVTLSSRGARFQGKPQTNLQLETIANSFKDKAHADNEKLKAMIVYAQTALCRWNGILKYFGEKPLASGCQHCDNCERKEIREGVEAIH